jgi:hypothetical protein
MTRPSGACPLVRPLRPDPFRQPAHLGFDIDRTVLTMGDQVADKLGDARPLGQQRVGQIEEALEIEVPGAEPQFAVKHRHPVAHIVKSDT